MATLTEAALDPSERRTLDRLVELLREEYGSDLHAVWLYGSRARGERTGPESDIDVLVITAGGGRDRDRSQAAVHRAAADTQTDPWAFSLHPYDPARVARDRAIESFFFQEVDRDKILLFDDGTASGMGGEDTGPDALNEKMKARSEDFMAVARGRLALARLALAGDLTSEAVEPAYYASLNAARAALSEEHGYAKTHSGVWHLFRQTFVVTGRFDAATFQGRAQRPEAARRRYLQRHAGSSVRTPDGSLGMPSASWPRSRRCSSNGRADRPRYGRRHGHSCRGTARASRPKAVAERAGSRAQLLRR